MSLDECLRYLSKNDMDVKIPLVCYEKINFPNRKGDLHLKPGKYYPFYKTLSSDVHLASEIVVYPDLKFKIPTHLKDQLQHKQVIIPIIIGDNYQGLLKNGNNWTMFVLPGSHPIANQDKMEQKILKLLKEKLGLLVNLFYQSIKYKPKEDSFDYPWWPSWLINIQMKSFKSDRESIINKGLEKLLTDHADYQNFVNNFNRYIKHNHS